MLEVHFVCGLGRRLVHVATPSPGAKRLGPGLYNALTNPPGAACAAPTTPAPTASLSGNLPLLGDGTAAITVELAGFPLAKDYTATVSFNAGTAVSKDIPMPAGTTGSQAATLITSTTGLWNADVAAVQGPGANVVVTPAAGKTLTALAVVFA